MKHVERRKPVSEAKRKIPKPSEMHQGEPKYPPSGFRSVGPVSVSICKWTRLPQKSADRIPKIPSDLCHPKRSKLFVRPLLLQSFAGEKSSCPVAFENRYHWIPNALSQNHRA